MLNVLHRLALVLLFVSACVCVNAAAAEPEVSVSITGTVKEMLPLLELLKNMGYGLETPENDDVLRLEIHSVVSDQDLVKNVDAEVGTGLGGTAPAEEANMEALGIYKGQVLPAAANPGDKITLSVIIGDPDKVVDTVGISIVGIDDWGIDLYDNASSGDETAKDGVWTRAFVMPQTMPKGEYLIEIVAYDKYGDPITASGEQLRTRIPIEIK